ncbi:MAG: adenylate/guanylate cyclase domain-containing protein [Gemmatimonadota bacterium]
MNTLQLQHLSGPLRFAIGPHRLVLGRALSSDLLVADPAVSRRHADLRLDGDALLVRDLGSSNGTSLNGIRITEALARPNDVLAFGTVSFRVEAQAEPAAWDEQLPGGTDLRPLTDLLPTRGQDREARTLARLLEVAADLSGPMPVARLCETVAELAFDQVDADRVVVLLGTEGGFPGPVAWRNRIGSTAPRVPRIIVQQALDDGVPVITESATEDDRLQSGSVHLEAVRSALCVPFQDGEGRTFGALYADTVQRTVPFDEDDARALQAFAGLAAAAIARTRFAAEAARERELRTGYERFLAPEVAEQIASDGGALALAGARREVAIVFGDLRGFSPLAEQLAPEQAAAVLTSWFTIVSEVVFDQGGTLDKFIGDGFLAVWGAPLPRSDAADRALFAARAIREAVHRLRENEGVVLRAGFGLSFGEVFAGNVGSERRLEYTVVGDPVNVAARLCEMAGASEILMTGALVARLADRTHISEPEPVSLRGRSATVEVASDRNGAGKGG